MSSKRTNKLINDVEMDRFCCSVDHLDTTGVSTCVGIIVLLDNGQDVFVEHRSDMYLPAIINLRNVRLCFQNIAKHIFQVLPKSNITGVLMLGGASNQKHFRDLQKNINLMIQIGVDRDNNNESHHYKQLLNNIIHINICFNKFPESEKTVGAASLDLVVDKYLGDGERLIVVVQRVKKFIDTNTLIGVVVIGTKTNNRWFAIDHSVIQNKQGKTHRGLQYLAQVVTRFQSCATALGAKKVKSVMARHFLSYGQSISSTIMIDPNEKQIKLDFHDQMIYENLQPLNNEMATDDGDEDQNQGDDGMANVNKFKLTTM